MRSMHIRYQEVTENKCSLNNLLTSVWITALRKIKGYKLPPCCGNEWFLDKRYHESMVIWWRYLMVRVTHSTKNNFRCTSWQIVFKPTFSERMHEDLVHDATVWSYQSVICIIFWTVTQYFPIHLRTAGDIIILFLIALHIKHWMTPC